MQTFLPYKHFSRCAECLDDKRLYKQVVECKQILNVLKQKRESPETKVAWENHPAVLMWEGYERALRYYQLILLNEWLKRRWQVSLSPVELMPGRVPWEIEYPPWLGDERLHDSHKAMLYRKDPEHYSQFKEVADEYDDSVKSWYYWPVTKDTEPKT